MILAVLLFVLNGQLISAAVVGAAEDFGSCTAKGEQELVARKGAIESLKAKGVEVRIGCFNAAPGVPRKDLRDL